MKLTADIIPKMVPDELKSEVILLPVKTVRMTSQNGIMVTADAITAITNKVNET